MAARHLLETAVLLSFAVVVVPAVWAQPGGGGGQLQPGNRVSSRPPIGRLASSRLAESSGIVKSRKYPDVFWTHNDSGNPPVLFAVKLTGEVVAEINVRGARNIDWEDIAIDNTGRLFIGDIGDNRRSRDSYEIYVLPEPDPFARPLKGVPVMQTLRYRFPDGGRNCEALFIYEGKLHLITKKGFDPPVLYRLEPKEGDWLTPMRVGTVPRPPITAADVSLDGKRLAVCSYGRMAVYQVTGDLSKIHELKASRIPLPVNSQTEACCFDGDDVIVTAESREIWRISLSEIQSGR